ncbi:MAG: hypothetical protein SVY10_20125 [Thermodesulfobacteriota bacterium]|nr:hypothetical protein [Thermodesulfobacteriota bacterium]
MKAGIFFTGTGPILILTSYDSLNDPKLVEKLIAKGIKKFIAYEVDEDIVKKRYGNHYNVVMGDLHQTDDLRVLDFNGHSVFRNFSFKEIKEPVYHESGSISSSS